MLAAIEILFRIWLNQFYFVSDKMSDDEYGGDMDDGDFGGDDDIGEDIEDAEGEAEAGGENNMCDT